MELEALVETPRALPGGWRIEDGVLDLAPLFAALLRRGLCAAARRPRCSTARLIAALADWIGGAARRAA